ncbi:MAG: AI-2E family transporter [Planctomycetota bacterium]|jgi:AI-2 transport protein TqsA
MVALAVVLLYTRVVMIPFVLAVFVVSLVSPVLDFQVIHLKFPRPVAVILTLLLVAVIIALLCLVVAQAVQTIIDTARPYSDSFVTLAKQVFPKLNEWGIELDQKKILSDLANRIPALVTNTLGSVLGFASTVFFVLIFVMFLLAGRNPHVVRSGVYADIDQKVRRYIATKTVVSTVTGLLVWATLAVTGLELAGVFGILAFLLNFIPSVGSVISTLLPIPVAAAQFQNPWLIAYVILVPGTIQMLIGNVLEPKFMGEGLHLHPITVLLALSFWGLLWGIGGMFLATPMTAVLRIILLQFDTLKPLGNLLAGELPGSEDSAKIT